MTTTIDVTQPLSPQLDAILANLGFVEGSSLLISLTTRLRAKRMAHAARHLLEIAPHIRTIELDYSYEMSDEGGSFVSWNGLNLVLSCGERVYLSDDENPDGFLPNSERAEALIDGDESVSPLEAQTIVVAELLKIGPDRVHDCLGAAWTFVEASGEHALDGPHNLAWVASTHTG